MARVAYIEQTGGPDVIQWADRDLPPPGEGEVRVRHTAVGLNFVDTYYRSGLYKVPLPSGLGAEAAGVVEALGAGVSGFAPGDRVATFVRASALMPPNAMSLPPISTSCPMRSATRSLRQAC